MSAATLVRALRLPFISASVLPFIFGYLAAPGAFKAGLFALGLLAVAAMHSGANLLNDWADSKSGADWGDRRAYGFFGGSKLIQEGVLTERFYLAGALICFVLAALSLLALAFVLRAALPLSALLIVLVLSVAYSARPFALSYHRLGELAIFVLFGPTLVMGGYYLSSGIFPDAQSFLLSLPFGFLTTAILFVNEVPDFPDDRAAGKRTWVSLTGVRRAWLLYALLEACAFAAVFLAFLLGLLSAWALLALFAIVLPAKAIVVLRRAPEDKVRLLESSRLTIATGTIVSVLLILATFA